MHSRSDHPLHALVVAQRPSDYVEMRRCAVALRQHGLRVSFQYHRIYLERSDDEEQIVEQLQRMKKEEQLFDYRIITPRWRYILHRGPRRDRSSAEVVIPSWKRRLGVAISTTIRALLRLVRHVEALLTYHSNYRQFATIIGSSDVDIIILPEDVVGLVTPLIIKAGHAHNVPTLIIPYTIANQQEAFRSLQVQPNYQLNDMYNRIAGWLFPKWIMKDNGVSLVRLPAHFIFGQELTRTAPPDPWMMNSGFANQIAVENEAMRDYYRAAGIPESKMRVVGAVYDDTLAGYRNNKASERDRLYRELGISGQKPLLVICGCPDQTAAAPPGFEFDDMADFALALADSVVPMRDSFELVVRPHPSYSDLGEMLAAHGLRMTAVDTARLVALSDGCIAFASATIRWAIACGVPTINYDVFHYGYDDFSDVEGVLTVSSLADFRSTVRRLDPSHPDRPAWDAAIAKSSARWGRLDGRSTARIVELIQELCALDPVPRTAA